MVEASVANVRRAPSARRTTTELVAVETTTPEADEVLVVIAGSRGVWAEAGTADSKATARNAGRIGFIGLLCSCNVGCPRRPNFEVRFDISPAANDRVASAMPLAALARAGPATLITG